MFAQEPVRSVLIESFINAEHESKHFMQPGDRIVYVGVASEHRHAAFDACAYIMDYLKLQAPFWKKEITANGARWVDAREADTAAAQRWSKTTTGIKTL